MIRNTQCLTTYDNGMRCPHPCRPIGRCTSCLRWYAEEDPLDGRPWALRDIALRGASEGCGVLDSEGVRCGARKTKGLRWMCAPHADAYLQGLPLDLPKRGPGRPPKLTAEKVKELRHTHVMHPDTWGRPEALAKSYDVSVRTVYSYLKKAQ